MIPRLQKSPVMAQFVPAGIFLYQGVDTIGTGSPHR
jgi:hypothetical protein